MKNQMRPMFELNDIVINFKDPKNDTVNVEKNSMLPFFIMVNDANETSDDRVYKIVSGANSNVLFGNVGNVFAHLSSSEVKDILIKNKEYVLKRNISLRIFLKIPYMSDEILQIIETLKKTYNDIVIAVGFVSTPEAYEELSNAGADYVMIGTPNYNIGCGIGYPEGSLIDDVYYASCQFDNPAQIVAFTSTQTTQDMMKSFALGADYVLLVNDLHNEAYGKDASVDDNIRDLHLSLEQSLFFTGSSNLAEFCRTDFSFVTDSYKSKENSHMSNIKVRNEFSKKRCK